MHVFLRRFFFFAYNKEIKNKISIFTHVSKRFFKIFVYNTTRYTHLLYLLLKNVPFFRGKREANEKIKAGDDLTIGKVES